MKSMSHFSKTKKSLQNKPYFIRFLKKVMSHNISWFIAIFWNPAQNYIKKMLISSVGEGWGITTFLSGCQTSVREGIDMSVFG